ncbi:AzlD domain-containing protein [Ruegeria arenilitoris]|uniref:Branched-chain amino acid transport protein (AzlD) n=1 Tax=Ruegeria arenilitoris TaxID=1173585 RepID=A0A238KH52_9RHOB|nr:AzlD domain-containing protein [Ruegeria arenilitoris]SMX41416.1 Branched-chain amino acid transport protein (AzlD) [Ruegeria arenilitoris]
MTTPDQTTVWTIIVGLAIGSYALRFVFIGFVGDRPLPPWLLRHLRYTAVAILPALIAPLVMWPTVTEGQPDLPRMASAVVALSVGLITKNVLAAIFAGAGTLYGLLYLVG